jgi:hypothetical protein
MLKNDPRQSIKINNSIKETSERIANAATYFELHPESKDNAKFRSAYNELILRRQYLLNAKALLEHVMKQATSSVDAKKCCLQLSRYSVSSFMYEENSPEAMQYVGAVKDLQTLYPEWEERRLVFAARNINDAMQPGARLESYQRALRVYIETCCDYFLWIREMYMPIGTAPEKQTTSS